MMGGRFSALTSRNNDGPSENNKFKANKGEQSEYSQIERSKYSKLVSWLDVPRFDFLCAQLEEQKQTDSAIEEFLLGEGNLRLHYISGSWGMPTKSHCSDSSHPIALCTVLLRLFSDLGKSGKSKSSCTALCLAACTAKQFKQRKSWSEHEHITQGRPARKMTCYGDLRSCGHSCSCSAPSH